MVESWKQTSERVTLVFSMLVGRNILSESLWAIFTGFPSSSSKVLLYVQNLHKDFDLHL